MWKIQVAVCRKRKEAVLPADYGVGPQRGERRNRNGQESRGLRG